MQRVIVSPISNLIGELKRRESDLKSQIDGITTDKLSDLPFDPKAPWIPRVIVRTSRGIRYLTLEIAQKIIDTQTKDGCPGSVHTVTSAAGLHFKQKPTHPLMEYAIHSLFFRLAGELTPPSELACFEVDGRKPYPVLISNTVSGQSLKQRVETPLKLEKPEQWARWTWMLLCSILTRPGAGNLSSYIVDPNDNIYCIDNEFSFIDPVVQKVGSQIHYCCALFCLFQDRPLDQSVLAEFCSLNADTLLLSWIDDVIKKEEQYSKLFTEEERKRLYDEDPKNRFKTKAVFKKGVLATLISQFIYLQNQLNALLKKNKTLTPPALLNYIIALSENPDLMNLPGKKLFDCYSEGGLSFVEDRMKGTSMTSVQTDQVCFGRSPTFEEVEKSHEFSAKKAKEELVVVSQRSPHLLSDPTSGNGEPVYQANFKEMSEADVPDLERQRHALLALTSRLQDKLPTSLAIQHCAVLDTKFLEPFLHQDLEYLDLSYCPNIKNSDVEAIQKKCPKLKELCLSGCSGVIAIETWKIMGSECLSFNNLRVLTAESCQNLIRVNLKCSGFQIVNLSHCRSLVYVELASFFQVEKSYENCPKLQEPITVALDLEDLKKSGRGLFNDRKFMLVAVQQNGLLLKYASEEFKKDRDIVLAAVQQNGKAFEFASSECGLFNDRKFILVALQQNGLLLKYTSEELKKDRDIVLAAVKQNGEAFMFASKQLREDREISLIAARQNVGALKYVGLATLKNDREIMLLKVEQDWTALAVASVELQNDKDFVLAVVQKNGRALAFACARLRNDRDIVLAAVKQNGQALQFASIEFRDDIKIVQAAVEQNECALQYASARIKDIFSNDSRYSRPSL